MIPDATAGIDQHNDECAKRGDEFDAQKAAGIARMAETFVESDDHGIQHDLIQWWIDSVLALPKREVIIAALKNDGLFGAALREASANMARDHWVQRHGE